MSIRSHEDYSEDRQLPCSIIIAQMFILHISRAKYNKCTSTELILSVNKDAYYLHTPECTGFYHSYITSQRHTSVSVLCQNEC